jgi:predicted N-acetyltransferase YhbS
MTNDTLTLRAATDGDLPAILGLLRQSMGRADDERFEELFRWKHLDNVFGRSPMWVACDDADVVGFRALMRWEFERGNEVFRAVRAVDTATHPDYQGRGIFGRLTLAAIAELEREGVDFVFNTPNAKSLPGYLKMGWQEVGRAPACVRPLSLRSTANLVRNRVPASHWSEPIEFGQRVSGLVDAIAADIPPSNRLRTRYTADFFRWRYAIDLLNYRAIATAQGTAIVRVRQRGTTREVVIAHAPTGRAALATVRRTVAPHADHLLAVGRLPGFIPAPGFGPIVTTRDVASAAPRSVAEFALSLGDVELF